MVAESVDRDDPSTRRRLAATFNEVPDVYDRVRPSYPRELIDDLIELGGLQPRDRVLEIGAGTGKASVQLAGRGLALTCLEPGPDLADHLRAKLRPFGAVPVRPERFEDFPAPHERFDAVVAATAWHWLDPDVRYVKAAQLVRTGGTLAIWGAQHAYPPQFDPFFLEIQKTYDIIKGRPPDGPWPPVPPEQTPDLSEQINDSQLYGPVAVRRYVWGERFTADRYIDLLETFSGHRLMPRPQREQLYREVRRLLAHRRDGMLTRHWLAILHVAHPRRA